MLFSLIAIAVLVMINGFFVAAEFALISARDVHLGQSRLGHLVRRQQSHLDESLSACQLGITIASLALGALGEPTIAALIEPYLDSAFSAHVAATIATVTALLIMTAMHITAGEQAPKSFAIGSAERVARICAGPLEIFRRALRPLVLVLNWVSNAMVRILGGIPATSHGHSASLEELRHLIGSVSASENLKKSEQRMLTGLFTLDERTVSDAMTPRHRVSSLEGSLTVSEALIATQGAGHSRFPVIDGAGQVTGTITVRELIDAQINGRTAEIVHDLEREMPFAPRTQPLDVTLARLQRERVSLCAVLDEYGQLDGVISIEDILEEIVGEIWDEDDLPSDLKPQADGSFLVPADTSLADLQSQDIELMELADGFDSVGGLVQHLLERIPAVGDSVIAGKWKLTVEASDGHRLERVRIHRAK